MNTWKNKLNFRISVHILNIFRLKNPYLRICVVTQWHTGINKNGSSVVGAIWDLDSKNVPIFVTLSNNFNASNAVQLRKLLNKSCNFAVPSIWIPSDSLWSGPKSCIVTLYLLFVDQSNWKCNRIIDAFQNMCLNYRKLCIKTYDWTSSILISYWIPFFSRSRRKTGSSSGATITSVLALIAGLVQKSRPPSELTVVYRSHRIWYWSLFVAVAE